MSYEGDLAYEVWRHGGNPDRVSESFVDRCRDADMGAEEAAGRWCRQERDRAQTERDRQAEEEAYYQQAAEDHVQAMEEEENQQMEHDVAQANQKAREITTGGA